MFALPKLGVLTTLDDFAPHVGKTWRVGATPQPITLQLDRLIPGIAASWQSRQPFVLVFSSPWEVLLTEALYPMQPDATSQPIEVYLIPTQSAPGSRRYYQAVFN